MDRTTGENGQATVNVLVARPDGMGDVLLAGPAVRAVAASGADVTLLAGPLGAEVARLLPGVARVEVCELPWVGLDGPRFESTVIDDLLARLVVGRFDEALILTSFHQSPLPLALLSRMAGIGTVAATSVDFGGGLLDHRLPYRPDLHEVEQNLLVAAALGHRLPAGDHGSLAVRHDAAVREPDLVVVHPSASVPARSIPPDRVPLIVEHLLADGWRLAITGAAGDPAVTSIERTRVRDLTGTTDVAGLARLLASAAVVVTGNTGPTHVAAAVGTPVVSIFAPVVDPSRWRPWNVPHRMLGAAHIACRGCRSRRCPLDGQPCLDPVTPEAVAGAVRELAGAVSIVDAARSA